MFCLYSRATNLIFILFLFSEASAMHKNFTINNHQNQYNKYDNEWMIRYNIKENLQISWKINYRLP